MEVTEKYANLLERQAKITLREAQKFRMLYDNFDPDWKPGDEPHGTMIFTDVPEPVSPINLIAQKREQAKQAAIASIKEYKGGAPWGIILYNLAIAIGWIEPE